MEMILLTIAEYASIWAPSLIAILGVIVTVAKALANVKGAIEEVKADKTLAEVNNKLTTIAHENEQLVKTNKILIDKITQIENYTDLKEK